MAQGPPPLSRRKLERILGLDHGSSSSAVLGAAVRLIGRLERRQERVDAGEREALGAEIEMLSSSVLDTISDESEASRPATAASIAKLASSLARERLFLAALLILGTLVVVLFAAWMSQDAAGDDQEANRVVTEPARLIVESRPKDASLRVRHPENEELLFKIAGEATAIELEAGSYEIEVSREDCPDVWLKTIDLESGETRRYEPTICVGAGEVVVRSNVTGDRLRIDDLDVGATREAPHLLGVGDHRIRVDKKGFTPFEGNVRVLPDERIEVRAELVAAAGAPTGGGGNAAGAEKAGAPLPFEVVAPSVPPAGARRGAQGGPPGLRQPIMPEPVAPDPIRPESLAMPDPIRDFESASGSSRVPKGGSTTWHDVVSRRLLDRFDADGSGQIDRASETEAIPCRFWKEIETSFDEGRLGLSMSRLYGFDGTEWHPRALGFAREQRGLAYERMKECGLAP